MAEHVRRSKQPTSRRASAVIYARVSSREQEDGWSIDAQLRLLRTYAREQNFVIAAEFVEAQTAKVAGRRAFGLMVDYISQNPGIEILIEKTDRLYRNLRDWVTIEDLGATLHFVREGQIVGPDSKSSDKLIHGFKVLMARNYVENLSEEIRKGMDEKALQGAYPSHSPLGYLNTKGLADRRKIIIPDPERASIIRRLFEEYEKGITSIEEISKLAWQIGLRTRKGNRVTKASIHTMLSNPVYCGLIRWKEKVVTGTHEPLVSKQLFDRCQEIMRGRAGRRGASGSVDIAYRGLVHCTCGRVMSGERKKGRYVYYHCQGPKAVCGRPYVKEEDLTAGFEKLLSDLTPPPRMQAWLRKAVALSHQLQLDHQLVAEKQLQTDVETARTRLERLYLDRVAGDISAEVYDGLKKRFEDELSELRVNLDSHLLAGTRTDEESLAALELSLNVLSTFKSGESHQRNATLKVLLSNCVWRDGKLHFKLRPPFDLMLNACNEPPAEPLTLNRGPIQNEIWWR